MAVSAKTMRAQLEKLKPLLSDCSLETMRKGQDMVGTLMGMRQRRQVIVKSHNFEKFPGAWVVPKDERRRGVILYLHGGGYVCGGLEYSKGAGSALADWTGTRVFCPAYRLAPENPFPAALEDALEAYRYLLSKGYSAAYIMLCGESAGGGLCYSLCLKLKQLGMQLPCGILAISAWTDLTACGPSYRENRGNDPSVTAQTLDLYAQHYTRDRKDPLVSPLFADLQGMPPSLIFAGGDEILRSDSQMMHDKLLKAGCTSQLVITPQRWHAYVLYGMEEDKKDRETINRFLNVYLSQADKLRWMRLDNAAKIYPAARRQNWSNVYRLSATLKEAVDVAVLQSALDVTVRRFPSIAARLRKGVFWYYLQQLERAPDIGMENSYPLTRMSRKQMRQCAFRVIVYQRRIAVELFHSLTDGTGALIFLKSLLAEYIQQKYDIKVPAQMGVLSRLEEPSAQELEDCFPKYAAERTLSRKQSNAWRLSGIPEPDGFLHITCFELSVHAAREKAQEYGVGMTVFLASVMLQALQQLQAQQVRDVRRRKPLKVLIPINLRNLFPSSTLRNFALFSTPELLPQLGTYSFDEICTLVKNRIGLDNTAKQMSMSIAANVKSEQSLPVKLMPLFIKNLVMKAAFNIIGERKACLCMSNLGAVQVPQPMQMFVERMDFILGTQAAAPYNCGVISYGDTLYVNFTRNIQHSQLEYQFYCVLRDLGLSVQVQSNRPQ